MLIFNIYYIGTIFFALGYFALMLRYIIAWRSLSEWHIPTAFTPTTSITIIIPARNEAANIKPCLDSIIAQYYRANWEVIVVDDHSDDATAALVQGYHHSHIRVISLADYALKSKSGAFKKEGIALAISQAKGELIITTDADCLVPAQWLDLIVSNYEHTQAKFIAAPVNFYQERNILERFQSLDFVGMMGITGAGIAHRFMRMCNGANLAYPKATFEAVNGFEGINELASGDDMLLMQKIAALYPNDIQYIKNKNATVRTHAKPTWAAFVQQRIRWASKSSSYQEWQVTAMLAIVFFFCCNILLNTLLLIFFPHLVFLWCFQLLIKIIADYLLLNMMSRFFDRGDLMWAFAPAFVLHTIYIAWVGTVANFVKKYEWKGRMVR